MNMIFAMPFSAVVEVFPFATHHMLYAGMAGMLGLSHYPVHTFNGTRIWKDPVSGSFAHCSGLIVMRWLFQCAEGLCLDVTLLCHCSLLHSTTSFHWIAISCVNLVVELVLCCAVRCMLCVRISDLFALTQRLFTL